MKWLPLFFCFFSSMVNAQHLYPLIDHCYMTSNNIWKITANEVIHSDEYGAITYTRIHEYNDKNQLSRFISKMNGLETELVHYFHHNERLIQQNHFSAFRDTFFLFYQYKKNRIARISRTNANRNILDVAELKYDLENRPLVLETNNLFGELLKTELVEYYNKNYIYIDLFAKNELQQTFKYDLYCKYNDFHSLNKKDFEDQSGKLLKFEKEEKLIRIVRGGKNDQGKERIYIEEITYDERNVWISRKIYELKPRSKRKKLVREINREIVYRS